MPTYAVIGVVFLAGLLLGAFVVYMVLIPAAELAVAGLTEKLRVLEQALRHSQRQRLQDVAEIESLQNKLSARDN